MVISEELFEEVTFHSTVSSDGKFDDFNEMFGGIIGNEFCWRSGKIIEYEVSSLKIIIKFRMSFFFDSM